MLAVIAAGIPVGHGHGLLEVAVAMPGLPEMLVVLAIVVVLFGATKLPQLGKGLGEAIGNFKRAQKEGEAEASAAAPREEIDATPRLRDEPTDSVKAEFDADKQSSGA